MKFRFLSIFLMFASLAAAVFPVWGQQRPEFPGSRRARPSGSEFVKPQRQATGAEVTVYVEITGLDTPHCGSQAVPCRTITQGLKRAQALQSAGSVQAVTMQVGPGTYTGRVDITSSWITLQGAGAGASFITNPDGSAVVVRAAQEVAITGFTISGGTGRGQFAVAVRDNALLWLLDSELRDSSGGVNVQFNSAAYVYSTVFSNNLGGAGACHLSLIFLQDVQITGKSPTEGEGVGMCDGAVGAIQNSSIMQVRTGIALLNSEVYTFRGVTITNTLWGVTAVENSVMELGGLAINNSSDAGMVLASSSIVYLYDSTISNSPWGIQVTGNSFLEFNGGQVNNNTTGILFDVFGHGLLRAVTYSGNGTNIASDRGGAYFEE